jgi:hypothetical protein
MRTDPWRLNGCGRGSARCVAASAHVGTRLPLAPGPRHRVAGRLELVLSHLNLPVAEGSGYHTLACAPKTQTLIAAPPGLELVGECSVDHLEADVMDGSQQFVNARRVSDAAESGFTTTTAYAVEDRGSTRDTASAQWEDCMRLSVMAVAGRVRVVGLVFGALIAVLGFAPTSVAASPPSSSDIVDVVVMPGTSSASDSVALSSCSVSVYGYSGKRICEFAWFYYTHSNGSREYFVVGTNYAVYHAWQGSGGWKSLGGQARRALPNGTYPVHDTGYEGVRTIGTDNWSWCRFNVRGTWSPWSDVC